MSNLLNAHSVFLRWKGRIEGFTSLALMVPLVAFAASSGAGSFNPSQYLTPALKYSVIGKGLSLIYEPQLVSMATRVNQEMKSNRFELIDTNRSPMASIGFFSTPSEVSPTVRFLGATARVNITLTYFPDDESGRLGDAMDAFGKDLLKILGDTLASVQDIGVRGAVLILIYSKDDLSNPNYFKDAEAVVIFIPKDTLLQFNGFRMRFDKLFEQSEVFSFKGADQIQNLFTEFLAG